MVVLIDCVLEEEAELGDVMALLLDDAGEYWLALVLLDWGVDCDTGTEAMLDFELLPLLVVCIEDVGLGEECALLLVECDVDYDLDDEAVALEGWLLRLECEDDVCADE